MAVTEEPWRTWPDERRGRPRPGRRHPAGGTCGASSISRPGSRSPSSPSSSRGSAPPTARARRSTRGSWQPAPVPMQQSWESRPSSSTSSAPSSSPRAPRRRSRRHDGPALNRLVAPLEANSAVPMVDVVEPDGRVLLAVRAERRPRPGRLAERAQGAAARARGRARPTRRPAERGRHLPQRPDAHDDRPNRPRRQARSAPSSR